MKAKIFLIVILILLFIGLIAAFSFPWTSWVHKVSSSVDTRSGPVSAALQGRQIPKSQPDESTIRSTYSPDVIIFSDKEKHVTNAGHCFAGRCSRRFGSLLLDPRNLDGRIVGGEEAKAHEFPWMAQIKDSRGNHICGGALLNLRFVLTADHCLDACESRICYVHLGVHDSSSSSSASNRYPIQRMIGKRSYGLFSDDLGLIQLTRNVTFNRRIKPICLPIEKSESEISAYDQGVTVAGWGLKEGGQMSTKLRKLSARDVLLEKDYRKHYSGCRSFLCLKSSGKGGFEAGDSGGPAWIVNEDNLPIIIGVISHYRLHVMRLTRVPLNVHWIRSTMGC